MGATASRVSTFGKDSAGKLIFKLTLDVRSAIPSS